MQSLEVSLENYLSPLDFRLGQNEDSRKKVMSITLGKLTFRGGWQQAAL